MKVFVAGWHGPWMHSRKGVLEKNTHTTYYVIYVHNSAWRLATPTCILRGRRGTYGAGLALVARLGPVWTRRLFARQAWHLAT